MIKSDLLTTIISTLNDFLASRNNTIVDLDSAVFAYNGDVVIEGRFILKKCYSAKAIRSTLGEKTCGGPSWIHANLVIGPLGEQVIILDFGANVGNPDPTINVSFEYGEIERPDGCM